MGFFKDFKRDFAQAVNELMPEDGELSSEYDDEDMVNTFDDADEDADTDIDPEDLLEEDFEGEEDEQPVETLSAKEEEKDDELFESAPDTGEAALTEAFEEESGDSDREEDGEQGELPQAEQSGETDEEELEEAGDFEEDDESDEEYDEEDEEDFEEIEEEAAPEAGAMSIDAAVKETLVKEAEEEADDFDEVDDMDDREIKTKDIMTEKKENIESVMSDDTTYITKGTRINGDIETDGGVDVLGSVTGNIKCMGKLILGGQVKGNVTAGEIYANAAKLEGEVVTDGGVKIGVGSVVIGNVTATSAVIAGAINGDIDVKGPVIVDSTAVVMGNIKSRSVQINNGAVIEGFCSQCYSEIDVKSFFGNAD